MSKKILIGIIILFLLSNVYFYWQNQSIIEKFKKLDTLDINSFEFQSSIFPIDDMNYYYYEGDRVCDECCWVNGICDECIEKHNECAEEYNKCKDDYESLVRKIDFLIEKQK